MSTDTIRVAGLVAATPQQIFDAFLDGPAHAAMTSAPATCEGTGVGARTTAWGGYIDARTIALEPPGRIVQAWRTQSFPEDAPDSWLEILLDAVPGGCRVTFVHSEIPAGQGQEYEGGWVTHYLEPMAAHWGLPAGG
jgi:uncharacterized protein YndB with AHSA1/START domain